MAQLAHVDITETPVDLSDGLKAGCYIAQVRRQANSIGVLYATAETAPASTDDYFVASGEAWFRFTAGRSLLPVWCRTVRDGDTCPLAIGRA